MKSKVLLFLFLIVSSLSFAQSGYKKVYEFGDYHKDWAMVKTISGTYGFIDKNKNIVVQPIYTKIEKFGKHQEGLAMVKSIADSYGFIDQNGKEVIPAIYTLDEVKNNFKGLKRVGK
ncbi:WG repeat-containing protein [uncultured Flavobacterium sp.]|mgnify:CR=1 FL=1|uniref:WG repeat-containing protein n=1 Tax=uncultured Flavobacterium sp. TaxID=165435 RepID=UPI0025CB95B7|nr:WG repeat-containing protein [uncultured Flavobacterium sp.]